MTTLFGAELRKTVRRPFDVALTLVVIVLSALAPALIVVRALREPGRAALLATELVWPFSASQASFVLSLIALLGAPMLAASSVGGEYDAHAWATLVARRHSRYPLLLAKVSVLLLTIATVMLLAVATTTAGATIGRAAIDAVPDAAVLQRRAAPQLLLMVAFAVADAWWAALMAAVGVMLLRSSLAGALIGILIPQLLRAVLSPETAFLNPAAHFIHLRQLAGMLPAGAGYDVGTGPIGSIAVIVVYAVALTAAMAYWFEKKEISV